VRAGCATAVQMKKFKCVPQILPKRGVFAEAPISKVGTIIFEFRITCGSRTFRPVLHLQNAGFRFAGCDYPRALSLMPLAIWYGGLGVCLRVSSIRSLCLNYSLTQFGDHPYRVWPLLLSLSRKYRAVFLAIDGRTMCCNSTTKCGPTSCWVGN
jgi:hypothetical protein